MSSLKNLVSQTAVYGLSSIVGRFLNFLLVPLYTRVFVAGEYGVVTQMFAYVSFLAIIFTYGLETAFFRYSEKEKGNPNIYSTALISIILSSISLTGILILFSPQIAEALSTGPHSVLPQYISWFALVLALDAIAAIPFARLRQENDALRFAVIKVINILTNVGLNIFFLIVCPKLINGSFHSVIAMIYSPSLGIGYVFLSLLVSNVITLLLLTPEILRIHYKFDSQLWKSMIIYALPLMIAGFAGMINETFDRILLPILIPDKSTAMEQIGIYGACYKLSILMTLFVQTFRYAAEPFFFSHSSKENAREVYSRVMHYFVIVCSFIFLAIMMYIDIVKYFIGSEYRSGLKVVPVLLMANLCLGVYYNLSIWYKLTGQTKWGAWLSMFGAVITLALNFWWIPIMGYMGAAWATLACYASMMVLSYVIGQKYYSVPYHIRSFLFYISSAPIFYIISTYIRQTFELSERIVLLINTGFVFVFIVAVFVFEGGKNSYLRIPLKKGSQ